MAEQDWRDITIGEGLHWLKLRLISGLLALGLIEDYGPDGINGTTTIQPREEYL